MVNLEYLCFFFDCVLCLGWDYLVVFMVAGSVHDHGYAPDGSYSRYTRVETLSGLVHFVICVEYNIDSLGFVRVYVTL